MNPLVYAVFELIQTALMVFLFALILGDDRRRRK